MIQCFKKKLSNGIWIICLTSQKFQNIACGFFVRSGILCYPELARLRFRGSHRLGGCTYGLQVGLDHHYCYALGGPEDLFTLIDVILENYIEPLEGPEVELDSLYIRLVRHLSYGKCSGPSKHPARTLFMVVGNLAHQIVQKMLEDILSRIEPIVGSSVPNIPKSLLEIPRFSILEDPERETVSFMLGFPVMNINPWKIISLNILENFWIDNLGENVQATVGLERIGQNALEILRIECPREGMMNVLENIFGTINLLKEREVHPEVFRKCLERAQRSPEDELSWMIYLGSHMVFDPYFRLYTHLYWKPDRRELLKMAREVYDFTRLHLYIHGPRIRWPVVPAQS